MGQRNAVWNLGLQGGPLFLAIIVGVLVPSARRAPDTTFATACLLWGIGLALLVTAKAPALRSGQWLSFGSRQMAIGRRLLYRGGYTLVVLGCLTASGFVVIAFRTSPVDRALRSSKTTPHESSAPLPTSRSGE